MLPPTAYGRHLALILAAALRAAPAAWTDAERKLVAAFTALDASAADLVARLAQRRRDASADRLDAESATIAAALASGWIAEIGAPDDGQARADFAAVPVTIARVAATAAARRLHRAAVLVAFADPEAEPSLLVRMALGQLRLDAAAPLARLLAGGGWPIAEAHPLAERAAIDAFLSARDALGEGPSAEAYAVALIQVEAAAGRAQALVGGHLDPLRPWAKLLWDCLALPALGEGGRARALRALRRAPLGPSLARRVWTETWRRQPRPDLRRRLAAACAQWSIWPAGDRERWALRAQGKRATRAAESWPTAHVAAWLDRGHGAVRAEGLGVEAHALRHLAGRGFAGVHGEGGFWLALAARLFRHAVAARPPGVWPAPLQRLPLDWGRWGFAHRRRAVLAAAAVAIVRDPLAVLADSGDAGDSPTLDEKAAEAVCRSMPRGALVDLCLRVLCDPGEASGLPDLIAWRDDALELWEVKSPADQLSDRQRAWLTWLNRAGVRAGVLRIDEREQLQRRLWATALPVSAVTTVAPRAARRHPTLRPPDESLRLWWTRGVLLQPHLPIATSVGTLRLGLEPLVAAARWNGRLGDGAVDGWDRPVIGIAGLTPSGILSERRGQRGVTSRRVFPLPDGWVIPVLITPAADPEGGVGASVSVLMRAAGWLVPRTWMRGEPVAVPAADLATVSASTRADWLAHPPLPPWRGEDVATAAGYGDQLVAQLALLGSEPHALLPGPGADTLDIALPETVNVLWTMMDPRVRRIGL